MSAASLTATARSAPSFVSASLPSRFPRRPLKWILLGLVLPLLALIAVSNLYVLLRNPSGAAYASVKAARDGGAVVLALGLFVNAVISFLIVSAALFFVVKMLNRLRRQEEAAPPAPPEPTAEVRLLGEIRDLLRR